MYHIHHHHLYTRIIRGNSSLLWTPYSGVKWGPRRTFYEGPVPEIEMFNRDIFLKRKKTLSGLLGGSREFDYVRDEIAEQIVDRMRFVSYQLPTCVEIAAGRGHTLGKLSENLHGIQDYYMCDPCEELLHMDADLGKGVIENVHRVVVDEEKDSLPFEQDSVDAVVCGMYTHWINNLPNVLGKAHKILKPDGVFFGAILGGDTLHELRSAFVLAEQEREGGVSPHVSPFAGIRDVGNVLTRAGFKIPTIDSDTLTVYYPDGLTMMHHLQLMGENNALIARRPAISRETVVGAAAILDSLFMTEKGVPATFEVIYLVGWKAHPSQQQPARRGSAQISLKDLAEHLGTTVEVLHAEDGEDEDGNKENDNDPSSNENGS